MIEEYRGQKIDDIQKYGVDVFAIGSDWEGYFDYLNEFCKVIYLPRTQGVSSTFGSLVGIIEKHSKSNKKKQSKCYFDLFIYFTGYPREKET